MELTREQAIAAGNLRKGGSSHTDIAKILGIGREVVSKFFESNGLAVSEQYRRDAKNGVVARVSRGIDPTTLKDTGVPPRVMNAAVKAAAEAKLATHQADLRKPSTLAAAVRSFVPFFAIRYLCNVSDGDINLACEGFTDEMDVLRKDYAAMLVKFDLGELQFSNIPDCILIEADRRAHRLFTLIGGGMKVESAAQELGAAFGRLVHMFDTLVPHSKGIWQMFTAETASNVQVFTEMRNLVNTGASQDTLACALRCKKEQVYDLLRWVFRDERETLARINEKKASTNAEATSTADADESDTSIEGRVKKLRRLVVSGVLLSEARKQVGIHHDAFYRSKRVRKILDGDAEFKAAVKKNHGKYKSELLGRRYVPDDAIQGQVLSAMKAGETFTSISRRLGIGPQRVSRMHEHFVTIGELPNNTPHRMSKAVALKNLIDGGVSFDRACNITRTPKYSGDNLLKLLAPASSVSTPPSAGSAEVKQTSASSSGATLQQFCDLYIAGVSREDIKKRLGLTEYLYKSMAAVALATNVPGMKQALHDQNVKRAGAAREGLVKRHTGSATPTLVSVAQDLASLVQKLRQLESR